MELCCFNKDDMRRYEQFTEVFLLPCNFLTGNDTWNLHASPIPAEEDAAGVCRSWRARVQKKQIHTERCVLSANPRSCSRLTRKSCKVTQSVPEKWFRCHSMVNGLGFSGHHTCGWHEHKENGNPATHNTNQSLQSWWWEQRGHTARTLLVPGGKGRENKRWLCNQRLWEAVTA